MQDVVIVHLLKKGFGLQVSQGQVGGFFTLWQVASQSDDGRPFEEPLEAVSLVI